MSTQTKLESLVETVINVAIGFVVSASCWPLVCWWLAIPYNNTDNLIVTVFFTVLSIARGYIVRRWFNARLHQAAITVARKLSA